MSRRFMRPMAFLACFAVAGVAVAWKPKTHIYLADLALKSIENGKIAIYKVNHDTGQVLDKLGDYGVDTSLVDAITANRPVFNAGVLGPDAYPDIVTGQTVIHSESALDEGSNSWLEHVWTKSRTSNAKVKAFVAGYLFHAAGDMYAHTYMNYYSGGDFAVGLNALRHLVLEGYLGKLTPSIANKTFSIRMSANDNVVRDWIYTNMIRADVGSALENRLLLATEHGGPGAKLSVPRVFSRLRNYLSQEVAELGLSRERSRPLSVAKRAYLQAWIEDIDDGLKAWPYLSEKLAALLVYNLDETMTTSEMKEQIADHCNDYLNQHLLSMMGAPDFVGLSRAQIQAVVDPIMEPFEDQLKQIKDDLVNSIVKAATGYTLDEIADKINRPENYFDSVLGPKAPKPQPVPGQPNSVANPITLAQVNAQLQRVRGQWVLRSLPAAYNTVLMTQLILLSKPEAERLVADLKAANLAGVPTSILSRGGTLVRPGVLRIPVPVMPDNLMLGFLLKLDGDNQWRINGSPLQMHLVRTGTYNKIFMKMEQEQYEPVREPIEPVPSGDIKVTVSRVKAVDDIDPLPNITDADFYGRIEIDDRFKSFATVNDDNDISPNWTLSNKCVGNTITIRIRLKEEDIDADDLCDISPRNGVKTLRIFLNMKTGAITGDATGSLGQNLTVRGAQDSDRCEVTFKVEKT